MKQVFLKNINIFTWSKRLFICVENAEITVRIVLMDVEVKNIEKL
jgi:hypothetical protein